MEEIDALFGDEPKEKKKVILTNKSLMIGDWVYNTYNRQNEQVAEIGNGLVMLAYNDLYEYDEIEPIPLTPKILERNGFVIKKKWAQKGNFGDNPLIMWHFDDNIITGNLKHELEIHQNDTGKVHVRVQCDYVHELQHALRLIGFNDLADNFKVG